MRLIFGSPGAPTVALTQAKAWAIRRGAHPRFVDVINLYFELSPLYGIPPENPIGQASWETNDGHYTGVVIPSYHNWCGLKTKTATGDKLIDHQMFLSDRDGVIAHLQHLGRYGGMAESDLPHALIDPRFTMVTRFTSTIEGLGGSWAPALAYGERVEDRITSLSGEVVMTAQIPGFRWQAAAPTHFSVGRGGVKIRGGAQHYTAGTSSLDWLTHTSGATDPNKRVSATFLVKHTPSLQDRGWQLVHIEDTPWTTAFANPYTVSIEYEHDGSEPIPNVAYEVLAQTWADVTLYLRGKPHLGSIDMVKGHKEWVNNPSLTCPDGIDIARIENRWREILAEPVPQPEPEPPAWPPPELWLPGAKYPFVLGFRDHVARIGLAAFPQDPGLGALAVFGYPQQKEYEAENGHSYQRTERYVLEWQPGVDPPFDIVGVIRGKKIPPPKKIT